MASSRKGRSRKKSVFPGVEVRTGEHGSNISFGIPGERITVGTSGRVTKTSGYRTNWNQAFDPIPTPGGGPLGPVPGGVAGRIEQPNERPEEGWLNALPKPADEQHDPSFTAALEELDQVDPTLPDDFIPDRGPLRRKAEEIVDAHDPTSPEDWR